MVVGWCWEWPARLRDGGPDQAVPVDAQPSGSEHCAALAPAGTQIEERRVSGFSELDLPVLAKVLRRTVVSAIIVGAGAIIVPAPGPASPRRCGLGLGAASSTALPRRRVAKVQTKGETNKKVLRRLLGTRTATRLAS